MDISDLTDYAPLLSLLILTAGLLFLCLHTKTMPLRFLIGFVIAVCALCTWLDASVLWSRPAIKVRTVWSPDGRHVALLRKEPHGAIGSDPLLVHDRMVLRIRRAGTPWWNELFMGSSEENDQAFIMHWNDSGHLLVNGDPVKCDRTVVGVDIVCN